MYASLARFGYGIAKALRPSKVSKVLSGQKVQKLRKKTGKPVYESIKAYGKEGGKLASATGNTAQITKGGMKQAFKGYRKLYRGTLGTSNKRKVTTGVIGGGIGFDIFDDD